MSNNDTKPSGEEESKENKEVKEVKPYISCSHNYTEYTGGGASYYKCSKCNDVKIGGGRWTYNPR
jgi:hypothetical protein